MGLDLDAVLFSAVAVDSTSETSLAIYLLGDFTDDVLSILASSISVTGGLTVLVFSDSF